MAKIQIRVQISSYKGLVPGASHYWATVHEYEGELHFEKSFNSKAQAKQYAREIVEKHFGDKNKYNVKGDGGIELPWMYIRDGD